MTGDGLLTIICQFVNGELGIRAIKGPSNNPAPKERPYVTIYLQNVRQVGERMNPGPVREGQRKSKAIMQVANVQFYGVEDDGEALRAIRNALQSDEFDAFVESKLDPREDGNDPGFSVWELGDIVDNGFQDGTFYSHQKTMMADFQFYDFVEHTTRSIRSVDGVIGQDETFLLSDENGNVLVTEAGLEVIGDNDETKEPFHVEV